MTTILEILGTSTPVSEELAEELGLVKAAIVCRVFFYQNLSNGLCSASISTIAKKVGLSVGAVSSNLDWLMKNDYVVSVGEHKSGNTVNKYRVGPKFYQSLNKEHSRDESNIHLMNDNIHEMNGKEDIKEDIKETTITGDSSLDSDFARVCKTYEQEIGYISPISSGKLKDLMTTYPVEWIIESFSIAASANRRRLDYCEGILKRWKAEGKGNGQKPRANNTGPNIQNINGKNTLVIN